MPAFDLGFKAIGKTIKKDWFNEQNLYGQAWFISRVGEGVNF
jgi:hypothetical protein